MSSRILNTLAIVVCIVVCPFAVLSQTAKRPLITQNVDNTRLHTLSGNTRPEATAQNDTGAVPDNLAMDHMQMQLQRSAAQGQALQQFIDQLHNPKSPSYHKWLTAEQFGELYGSAQQDVDAVTAWLQSQGFTVNAVYPGRMTVDFSGNAGQVQQAFHTAIHYLNVNGVRHSANMSDPQIPAALAPAVAGIVSLHDFSPRPMKKARPAFTYTSQGYTNQAVVPADLATIYNLTPLFGAGVTGAGQTIAVIEDSNLYNSADWDTFRSTFGLSQYASGSLTTSHPSGGGGNCVNPGTSSGDDEEATLDAEYASAAAPGASIVLASCADTRTTFGGMIALQNLIGGANPPGVISISYGECEAENGAASNAAFNSAYQQAVAEGVSVFVAAGDEGAASCDAGATGATHGIGVSSWASTQYNVAVGGTDFGDTYAGTNSTYWGSTNTSSYGSALSYIPEIPWDDSCASGLLASALGFSATYGTEGLCSSTTARQDELLEVEAGSGGPSGCATGNPTAEGIVSGTCQGYAKPSWQAGLTGNPNDNVRDIPDVSLFAGTGIWGHYYVVCFSDVRNGGSSCDGDPSTWAGAGGTSFASPIMAGIQALVNQSTGSLQGNPNYVYYQIAAAGTNTCNSANGDPGVGSCVFHNVTQGDIDVNCEGSQNCFGATQAASGGGLGHRGGGGGGGQSSANGALSTNDSSYLPAFLTATGWNFATGIGSVNALNLVNNWITGQ
jgi:subtilase family serine protease